MAKTDIEVYELESYEVASWSPGDVSKGDKTTQVHVLMYIKDTFPLVLRIKSRQAANELIDLLSEYRDEVWPECK